MFCTKKSKIHIFLHRRPEGPQKPLSSVIGSDAAWLCENHEACLATAESPFFRHHPREMPNFISSFSFSVLAVHILVDGADVLQECLIGIS
jgi:hypothetical protein